MKKTVLKIEPLLVVIGLLSAGLVSCRKLPALPVLRNRLPVAKVDFRIQSQPGSGRYQLIGNANFPNETELNLLAIRLLQPAANQIDTQLTYSILDYQVVKIIDGQWQGELNLWQKSTTGQWQETWQLDQSQLDLQVKPLPSVVFLATFTPLDQLTTLEGVLARQDLQLAPDMLRTTPDGRRYLQMAQTLDLEVPASDGQGERWQPHNWGWGTRYRLVDEPPMPYQVEFPEERQTDRPGFPEEFLY